MEDILASIRRILNEDDAQPSAAPPEAEPFALTEAMLVGGDAPAADAPAAPPAETPTPPAAVEPPPAVPPEPEPEPMTETAAPPPATPEPAPSLPEAANLLAPAAAAAAAASVGNLLRAVSADRHAAVHRGGPTIEDLVREEIRPLLKAWLDEHLPPMVERLVRTEIERVVGRALS
ncbi:DUF2497 domain-containing protein [Roseomonas hellenica]|uniref:DUF2497 domain-containing protein n=1 Tax=Plastoroseomonas hellenica TaxID=2687306 RepID=A0ABS5EZ43_9PROT|nr:DUF2497 domain-containing protein [Plastoroseomonas hellenica]MBR0665563.1 DUF2497 domain-containing protein [Plastoroseomonas hellenica]